MKLKGQLHSNYHRQYEIESLATKIYFSEIVSKLTEQRILQEEAFLSHYSGYPEDGAITCLSH